MTAATSTYEDYIKSRGEVDLAAAEAEYRKFSGLNEEFDGGDSGGGVVGDGNTDLEDQHNSPSVVRGGFDSASAGSAGDQVGRGNVKTIPSAREMSAKGNYFGRSTGYAAKLIEQGMDPVRAQQLENWHNQNDLAALNRQRATSGTQGQLGTRGTQGNGKFKAVEWRASTQAREGRVEGEVSQRELAKHLEELTYTEAKRLDGEEWGPLEVTSADAILETFSMRTNIGKVDFKEINQQNSFNTFAPFRCAFTEGSDPSFTVTPPFGTMNRREGEPIPVVVRYTPKEATTDAKEATLIFETEDFKAVYKFIGST